MKDFGNNMTLFVTWKLYMFYCMMCICHMEVKYVLLYDVYTIIGLQPNKRENEVNNISIKQENCDQ